MLLGLRQEIRWRLDNIAGRVKCFFGVCCVESDIGQFCIYCGKRRKI